MFWKKSVIWTFSLLLYRASCIEFRSSTKTLVKNSKSKFDLFFIVHYNTPSLIKTNQGTVNIGHPLNKGIAYPRFHLTRVVLMVFSWMQKKPLTLLWWQKLFNNALISLFFNFNIMMLLDKRFSVCGDSLW